MFQGVRQIKCENSIPIYYIKTKTWKRNTWSVRQNPRTKDIYIISRHENFATWHKDVNTQLCVIHEWGHINKHYRYHFIDELMATLYGYCKYKYLCPSKPNMKDLYRFFLFSWYHMIHGSNFIAHLKYEHSSTHQAIQKSPIAKGL